MTDRELLELAAKAIGFSNAWYCEKCEAIEGEGKLWNPLYNDGDALRLSVKLGISITTYPIYAHPKHSVITKQYQKGDTMRTFNPTEVVEQYGEDPYASTRRAIVRTAAEIGKSMK